MGPEPPALPLVARPGSPRGGDPPRRELRQGLRPRPAEVDLDAHRRLHAGHLPRRTLAGAGRNLDRPVLAWRRTDTSPKRQRGRVSTGTLAGASGWYSGCPLTF